MELRFANAWMLYLLWLVPLLLAAVIAALKAKERRIAAFVSPIMQKRLRPTSDINRQIWQGVVTAAGILLCMIALARPQWGRSEQRVFRKGRDVVIALDVSRSMLANDVHPNRLMRAKIDVMDLLNDIEGDRVALIAFRHKAIPLCPLTTDYAFMRHILDMSGLHSAPRGETDIGDAILKAVEMLSKDDDAHKAVLLISDGEDLTGKALEAAETAAARNIPIFTVGFGRSSGSTIPDKETGATLKYKGKEVVSRLDNDTLYQIAKKTGGAYVPIQTASTAETTLGNIYKDHFSKIAAREMEETLSFSYGERFHIFLLPGILLILTACFLSKGRLAGNSKATTASHKESDSAALKNINPTGISAKTIALIALMLLPVVCMGATNSTEKADTAGLPEGRDAARKAQRLYDLGKYDDAAKLYLRAAHTITGPASESFTYNAAVSLFREGKHREAVDLLNTISGDGSIPLDRRDMALASAHYLAADNPSGTNEVQQMAEKSESLKLAAEHLAQAARLKTDYHDTAMDNAALILKELPEAQRAAREAELLDQYKSSDAFALLDKMLNNQRGIVKESAAAYTTDDPSQIQLLETLADRQKDSADLWIPLRSKLSEAASTSTNKTSIQALEKMADQLASTMQRSSRSMKDLDTSGYNDSAMAENGIYGIWKGAAPFSNLLTEDLRRQSNALENAESKQLRVHDQKEGADLTTLFKKRFLEAFPEGAPPPQETEDNEDAMTPEKRQKIIDLADAAKAMQDQALEAMESGNEPATIDRQNTAQSKLQEIQTLLPKQKQQQQDKQQNDQQQQDNKDQQKNQEPEQDPQKQPDASNQQQKDENPKDKPEESEPKDKDKPEMSESDIERLLDKALQREKEHEEEKRKRSEFIPPQMIDRDW